MFGKKKKKEEEYKTIPEPQPLSKEVNPMDDLAKEVIAEGTPKPDNSDQGLDNEKEKLQARIDELEGKKPKEKTMVVRREDIPTQEVRRAKLEDGTILNLITVEEALTKFLED